MGNTYNNGQKLIGYAGSYEIAQWVMRRYNTLNFGTPCTPPLLPSGVPGIPDAERPEAGNPNDPDPELYYNTKGCILRAQSTDQGRETRTVPLIKTKWGQDEPYNEYSQKWTYPHIDINSNNDTVHRAATGCGATAIAHMMAYHKYPETYPFSTLVEGYDHIFTLDGIEVDSFLRERTLLISAGYINAG